MYIENMKIKFSSCIMKFKYKTNKSLNNHLKCLLRFYLKNKKELVRNLCEVVRIFAVFASKKARM